MFSKVLCCRVTCISTVLLLPLAVLGGQDNTGLTSTPGEASEQVGQQPGIPVGGVSSVAIPMPGNVMPGADQVVVQPMDFSYGQMADAGYGQMMDPGYGPMMDPAYGQMMDPGYDPMMDPGYAQGFGGAYGPAYDSPAPYGYGVPGGQGAYGYGQYPYQDPAVDYGAMFLQPPRPAQMSGMGHREDHQRQMLERLDAIVNRLERIEQVLREGSR